MATVDVNLRPRVGLDPFPGDRRDKGLDEERPKRHYLRGFLMLFLIFFGIFVVVGKLLGPAEGSSSGSAAPREEATPLKGEPALTGSLGEVPGALICPDFDTVSALFHLYSQAWEDQFRDKIMHGESRLVYGPPMPTPNPKDYGCELIPPGTKVGLERGHMVPVVEARLADGSIVHGVTMEGMVALIRTPVTPPIQNPPPDAASNPPGQVAAPTDDPITTHTDQTLPAVPTKSNPAPSGPEIPTTPSQPTSTTDPSQ